MFRAYLLIAPLSFEEEKVRLNRYLPIAISRLKEQSGGYLSRDAEVRFVDWILTQMERKWGFSV